MELLVVFVLQVEEVSILDGPHWSEASSHPYISQMGPCLILWSKTELTEIRARVELGEDDFFGLESIETYR